MKKYIILVIILSFQLTTRCQDTLKYFEGIITYKMSHKVLNSEIDEEKVAAVYGDQMTLTFKNGFGRKEYYYKGKLKQVRQYHPIKTLNSQYFLAIDTIYQYHPYKNDFNIIEYKILADTIIDSITLSGIRIKTNYKKNLSDTMTYIYYFYNKLRVNPQWYKDFAEGDWNKIIIDKKSLCYFFSIETTHRYINYYKIVDIQWKKIDDKEFELPKLYIKSID